MTPEARLRSKIESGDAIVGVIGLGYVGLPLAHALHEGGMRVLGFDRDETKIDALRTGRDYLKHIVDDLAGLLARSDRFEATADFDRLAEPDIVIVCLPTPLGAHREPDLSYVVHAGTLIGRTLRHGQLVILESTTYPGTTRGPFLEAMLANAPSVEPRHEPGRTFFVAYSPEREDPGRRSHTTRTIPKVVGGLDETSTALAALVYERAVETVVRVRSAEVAEASKLLENIFRAVNIAMVNEMKTILTAMDIDVWEVIEAASTKPFGFMPFHPGPGLGGHCIPIDPFYLTWKAKEVGCPTRFIELAGEVNTAMPEWVVEQIMLALNGRRRSIAGSSILVLGLAYKPDVDDTRESPSFEIIERLRRLGAEVAYSDPHVPRTVPVRRHDLGLESVDLTPDRVASADAVVIVTNHEAFDYDLIARHAALVVDTRNAMKDHRDTLGERLHKA